MKCKGEVRVIESPASPILRRRLLYWLLQVALFSRSLFLRFMICECVSVSFFSFSTHFHLLSTRNHWADLERRQSIVNYEGFGVSFFGFHFVSVYMYADVDLE